MLKAISLFTGIGGLDFGFEAAGFETVAAVEMDATCCRTIRLNRKWPVLEGDLHSIESKKILAAGGLHPVSGDARRLEDPRADTLTAYLRVLRDTKPRMFLLENVPGLAYKGKDEGMKHLLRGIDQINREAKTNYRVSWKVLNSVGYRWPRHIRARSADCRKSGCSSRRRRFQAR